MSDTEYIPEVCNIKPLEAFMSTDLNNKNKTYDDIAERILHFFGYPAVSVSDLHRDQIYDAISMAVERFYKHAGVIKEYLILDSRLYEQNHGIPIDKLCTISGILSRPDDYATKRSADRGPEQTVKVPDDVYITKDYIYKKDYYLSRSDYDTLHKQVPESLKGEIDMLWVMSQKYPDGIEPLSIISKEFFQYLISKRQYPTEMFKQTETDRTPFEQSSFQKSKDKVVTIGGERQEIYKETNIAQEFENKDELNESNYIKVIDREPIRQNKMFDYDIMDYRKVASVTNYSESGVSSITSLYNFDTSLAQQFFYTNQFNHRSFGLTTWYALHEWRNTYEKMLAVKRGWSFNKDTQYLTLTPQPRMGERFFGIVECWVEKPLKDVLKEPWVFDYALAIAKEMLGRVRSKWGDSVSMLGGGSLTGNALAQEGVTKQKELLDELIKNQAYGAMHKPRFFVG